jgi:hypothetical protein
MIFSPWFELVIVAEKAFDVNLYLSIILTTINFLY